MSDGFRAFLRLLHAGFYTFLNPLRAFLDALSRLTEYASLGTGHCRDEYQDQTARNSKQDFVRYSFYSHRLLLTALQKKSWYLLLHDTCHQVTHGSFAI